jgi:hypothetical protein
MRFEGREIDPVQLWSRWVDFPPNTPSLGFSPLVKCPNPNHETGKRHFQVNLDQPLVHCVSGETMVRTSRGLFPADCLVGEKVDVLTADGLYHPAVWKEYGVQQLWRISLSNGDELYATDKHEWVVSPTQVSRFVGVPYWKPKKREKVTTQVLEGRQLQFQTALSFDYENDADYLEGVRHGLVFGDGHVYMDGKWTKMRQYGESRELVQRYFKREYISEGVLRGQGNLEYTSVSHLPAHWKKLPSRYEHSLSYLRGFVAGLLAADGHVTRTGHWMIHQSNFENLVEIRLIAAHVGLNSTSIGLGRRDNPWTGEYAPNWKLTFQKASLFNNGKIDEKLVVHQAHRRNVKEMPLARYHSSVCVESVEITDRKEVVYCCEEPITHTWVAGPGYLSGNCFANCGISGTYEHAISMIEGIDERHARKLILRFASNRSGSVSKRNLRNTLVEGAHSGSAITDEIKYQRFLPSFGMDYLSSRGIGNESVAGFQIGWDAEERRIVIPAFDEKGILRFLIKRAVKPKDWPKYLYAPDGCEKSSLLFGACNIDRDLLLCQGIVLCEGSLDCMTLHQNGVRNAVAILGSKLSVKQSRIISRLKPRRVYLMFDKDASGFHAIVSADRLLKKYPIFICLYPSGRQDPAELTKAEAQRMIEKAVPLTMFKHRLPGTLQKEFR